MLKVSYGLRKRAKRQREKGLFVNFTKVKGAVEQYHGTILQKKGVARQRFQPNRVQTTTKKNLKAPIILFDLKNRMKLEPFPGPIGKSKEPISSR